MELPIVRCVDCGLLSLFRKRDGEDHYHTVDKRTRSGEDRSYQHHSFDPAPHCCEEAIAIDAGDAADVDDRARRPVDPPFRERRHAGRDDPAADAGPDANDGAGVVYFTGYVCLARCVADARPDLTADQSAPTAARPALGVGTRQLHGFRFDGFKRPSHAGEWHARFGWNRTLPVSASPSTR